MGGLHWRSLMDILRSPCTSHHDIGGSSFAISAAFPPSTSSHGSLHTSDSIHLHCMQVLRPILQNITPNAAFCTVS